MRTLVATVGSPSLSSKLTARPTPKEGKSYSQTASVEKLTLCPFSAWMRPGCEAVVRFSIRPVMLIHGQHWRFWGGEGGENEGQTQEHGRSRQHTKQSRTLTCTQQKTP